MNLDELKWDERGLISIIFQDGKTGQVLTLAYMNREALQQTLATGEVWVYRRSHARVMVKGEKSGRKQLVREVYVDCDGDALVMKVEQVGDAACHTGHRTCFFRRLEGGELREIEAPLFDPGEVYE